MGDLVNRLNANQPVECEEAEPSLKGQAARSMKHCRLWKIQIAGLLGTAVWAASDPRLEPLIRMRSFTDLPTTVGWIRMIGLALLAACVVFSLLALVICAVGSRPVANRSRSAGELFLITALVAVWCTLALNLDGLAWQGKRARFAFRVTELERIAEPLRTDWPDSDGRIQGIGPFMAYPFGRPTTLILLQAPSVANQAVYVSAVERCSSGAIRLQLTGSDGGDWVEWHPSHSRPSSFIGGLADSYDLCTATSIGSGWYLVRYNT